MADGSWDLAPEDTLKRLQEDCGAGWMIWLVPCWDGHKRWLTWCARRHADGALLHATQPEHLAEYIAAADEAVAAAAGELIWHSQKPDAGR